MERMNRWAQKTVEEKAAYLFGVLDQHADSFNPMAEMVNDHEDMIVTGDKPCPVIENLIVKMIDKPIRMLEMDARLKPRTQELTTNLVLQHNELMMRWKTIDAVMRQFGNSAPKRAHEDPLINILLLLIAEAGGIVETEPMHRAPTIQEVRPAQGHAGQPPPPPPPQKEPPPPPLPPISEEQLQRVLKNYQRVSDTLGVVDKFMWGGYQADQAQATFPHGLVPALVSQSALLIGKFIDDGSKKQREQIAMHYKEGEGLMGALIELTNSFNARNEYVNRELVSLKGGAGGEELKQLKQRELGLGEAIKDLKGAVSQLQAKHTENTATSDTNFSSLTTRMTSLEQTVASLAETVQSLRHDMLQVAQSVGQVPTTIDIKASALEQRINLRLKTLEATMGQQAVAQQAVAQPDGGLTECIDVLYNTIFGMTHDAYVQYVAMAAVADQVDTKIRAEQHFSKELMGPPALEELVRNALEKKVTALRGKPPEAVGNWWREYKAAWNDLRERDILIAQGGMFKKAILEDKQATAVTDALLTLFGKYYDEPTRERTAFEGEHWDRMVDWLQGNDGLVLTVLHSLFQAEVVEDGTITKGLETVINERGLWDRILEISQLTGAKIIGSTFLPNQLE
jgi:hypothetical protein